MSQLEYAVKLASDCTEQSAKRYEKLTEYFLSERTDMDDAIVACDTQDELDAVVDEL